MILLIFFSFLTLFSSCIHHTSEDIERYPRYFYPRVDFLQNIEPRGNHILFGTNPSYSLLSGTTTSTRSQPVYFSYSFNLSELRPNWYRPIQDFLETKNHPKSARRDPKRGKEMEKSTQVDPNQERTRRRIGGDQ